MATGSEGENIGQDGAEPVYGPAYAQAQPTTKRSTIQDGEPDSRLLDGPSPPYTAPYPPYPSDVPAASYVSRDVASGLAYFIGPAIYFLLAEPYRSSRQVRFHSWQAIFFFLAVAAARELEQLFVAMLPSSVAFTFVSLMLLVFFTGWLIAMMKAFQGGKWLLPVVGKYAEQTASTSSAHH